MIIRNIGFEPNALDKTFTTSSKCSGKGISRRRPDMVYIVPERNVAVIIEIDEDSHFSYSGSCEVVKISEQNEAIHLTENCESLAIYTIRVNPDEFDGYGGVLRKNQTLEERADTVGTICKNILFKTRHYRNVYQKVFFCFYHSKSDFLVDFTRNHFPVEIIK
jgi:hypothetical protein